MSHCHGKIGRQEQSAKEVIQEHWSENVMGCNVQCKYVAELLPAVEFVAICTILL